MFNVEPWLDLVEANRQTSEGLGMSDYFLYIGKKKPRVFVD